MLPESSVRQLKKLRSETKGTDIGDLTSNDRLNKSVPNLQFIGNPVDNNDSIESWEQFSRKDSKLQTIAFKSKLVNKSVKENNDKEKTNEFFGGMLSTQRQLLNSFNEEDEDDNEGKLCKKCKNGNYIKTQLTKATGELECDKCGDKIDRYSIKENKKKYMKKNVLKLENFENDMQIIDNPEDFNDFVRSHDEELDALCRANNATCFNDKLDALNKILADENVEVDTQGWWDDMYDEIVMGTLDIFESRNFEWAQGEEKEDLERNLNYNQANKNFYGFEDYEKDLDYEEMRREELIDLINNTTVFEKEELEEMSLDELEILYSDMTEDSLEDDVETFESFTIKSIIKEKQPEYDILGKEKEHKSNPNFGVAAEINKDVKKITDFNLIDPHTPKERKIGGYAGKYIDNDKVKGFINRIDGGNVWIESADEPMKIEKFNIKDIIKIKKEK